ncbi:ParB/RepB/Spo0J family partition protein [Acuticoccus sp. I52.16.1]|uniref:ParB/RepB/Spo0J family partition protein n=1 Tax=Acuticoccus sp. I52.16.1 TaxID=2928472 RepID=UPI001FD416EB|nr:ParB/RepB/Spo0J family partition protein [Acuticoccus sp. I52.16.1]UOM37231.1 ParB/RepB/Spo0J family partition protein [Acuticoccus sp. I52.16.1]
MAKSTRKRVASVLADIANEDDDAPRTPPRAAPARPEPTPKPPAAAAAETPPAASEPAAGPIPAPQPSPPSVAGAAAEKVEAAPPATPPSAEEPPAASRAEAAPETKSVPRPAPGSRAPGLGHLLNNWGEQSREAEHWRRALDDGAVVQEIATERITPFRWHDRFADFDDSAEFDALVESILREGQIAPALVRPHPSEAGRFELVYGHRRHRACVKLGRPLRAIVRTMDDEAAVTVLSRENSQHAPPSFIEKARQASKLLADTGWTVQFTADVLGVQRSEVSRYRMVMTLPDRLVMHIGGDPSIGRPTWLSLETLWREEAARARIAAELDRVERQEIRGARAMRRLIAAGRPHAAKGEVFRPRGAKEPVLRRDVTAASDKIVIDKRLASGFGDFLWDKLDDLWKEWNSRSE